MINFRGPLALTLTATALLAAACGGADTTPDSTAGIRSAELVDVLTATATATGTAT